MAEQRTQHSFMIPVLAGLAGAGLALLFAPKSGKETRADLQRKAQEAKLKAKQSVDTAQAKLEKGVEQAKDTGARLSSALKQPETTTTT